MYQRIRTGFRNFVIFNALIVTLFTFSLISVKAISNYQWLSRNLFHSTQQILEDNAQAMVLGETTEIKYADARVVALEQFLNQYNSPLSPYAAKIVQVSDQYNLHYGLLPAIAMVESGLCRKIPENSFNCWGWGIYGKTVTRFVSYDEAIAVVAKGIKEEYFDHGYQTPEAIMLKYNPSNHNNWLGGVNFFLEKLE